MGALWDFNRIGSSIAGFSIRIYYRMGFTIAFAIHSVDLIQSVDPSLFTRLISLCIRLIH